MGEASAVRINRLQLEQFRVYQDLALDIPPRGLRIIGANGSGKSTLLESIELLSTTRPRRGSLDADLIAHSSGTELGVQPYARAVGIVERGDVDVRIEVFIQRNEGRGSTRKLLRVADRPRRAGDVVGLVPTVTFAPDDLDMVLGAPSVRRRFLDVLLSQIDRRYLRYLSRYAKILAQRNGLLRQLAQEGGNNLEQFAYWDEQIVALGSYLIAARYAVVLGAAISARHQFNRLSMHSGELLVSYVSTLRGSDAWWARIGDSIGDIQETAQQIAVAYEQQLRDGMRADLARGATLIGPHRDDVAFAIGGHDLSRYGSRGQQRLAVLALKLAELETAASALNIRPILLLDDVLSELDAGHQSTLLDAARDRSSQMLITTTDRHGLDRPGLSELGEAIIDAPGRITVL